MPRYTGLSTNCLAPGSREISGVLQNTRPVLGEGTEFQLIDALRRSTEAYNIYRDLLNS